MDEAQPVDAQGQIRTEVDGSIGWLIIDNPKKRNSISLAMWAALPGAVETLDRNEQVRVIILRGAGDKSFVAGADISEFEETRATAEKAKAYEQINVAAFKAVKHSNKPTIAMIHGHCLGGGLGLALACDLRLADTSSVFGIPAARLGIAYPQDAISDILEAVSASSAKRLLFTAERLGPDEAHRIGLIDEVCEYSALRERITALAGTISNNAPLTLRAAKKAIAATEAGHDDADIGAAMAAAETCFDSEDFKEGRDAFLEKRLPHFKGR